MELIHVLQQNLYYILFAVFVLFLFKNRMLSKMYGLQSISVGEAFEDLKRRPSSTLFLDVRTSWELEREPRIKVAKLVPLSDVTVRMVEIKTSGTDKKIILVCRSSSRARSAGIRLKKAGFSKVFVMTGGMNQWTSANYPVIRPKRKLTKTYG